MIYVEGAPEPRSLYCCPLLPMGFGITLTWEANKNLEGKSGEGGFGESVSARLPVALFGTGTLGMRVCAE